MLRAFCELIIGFIAFIGAVCLILYGLPILAAMVRLNF